MAMVDAMPVPDSRQKVDELFLFWLSEPSTQEMLRNELTKVCRYGGGDLSGGDGGGDSPNILDSLMQQPTALTSVPRSPSPGYRTPSPPLHLSNSPKSPRTKRRAKSPRRNLKHGLSAAAEKSGNSATTVTFDDVDYFPAALTAPAEPPAASSRKTEKASGHAKTDTNSSPRETKETAKRAPQGERNAKRNRASNEVIPRFFFPNGRAGEAKDGGVEMQLKEAAKLFQEQLNGEVTMADFHLVVKVIYHQFYSNLCPPPFACATLIHEFPA